MSPARQEAAEPSDDFRSDVLLGLSASRKWLPSKYLYDQIGAQLFEQICALPEYYPWRTELAILERHGTEMAELLGERCLLIEYGSGASTKTRLLLNHLRAPASYIPIDISAEQLGHTAEALGREYPGLEVHPVHADFSLPVKIPSIGTPAARRVVYFPGSTIGNFTTEEAQRLLVRTARLCGPGGGLLMGADLKKDPRHLQAAYNDQQGITAAFNLNLLARINRELRGNFQLDRFWHYAFYNPREGRVEMHLISQIEQQVELGERQFRFAEGESICTEYSHKYRLGDLRQLTESTGFHLERVWMDERRYLSVLYLVAH